MKPTYYSEISEGALLVYQQILTAARENPEIKSLYRDCQLLFSPLLEKSELLLIGFNSGGGYFKQHGFIADNFEPLSAMENYLNRNNLESFRSFVTPEGVKMLAKKEPGKSIGEGESS